jgi:hypothetical protein
LRRAWFAMTPVRPPQGSRTLRLGCSRSHGGISHRRRGLLGRPATVGLAGIVQQPSGRSMRSVTCLGDELGAGHVKAEGFRLVPERVRPLVHISLDAAGMETTAGSSSKSTYGRGTCSCADRAPLRRSFGTGVRRRGTMADPCRPEGGAAGRRCPRPARS